MRQHPLKTLLLLAALALGFTTSTSAQMVLDLDIASGDQGVREAKVKPGDMKQIELVALQGAMEVEGFEIVLNRIIVAVLPSQGPVGDKSQWGLINIGCSHSW